MPEALLADIGKAIVYLAGWGVSVAAATWAVVKFVPQQMLQHRFDRQLEQQRNEHAQQLQEARHRLDTLQKRLSILHEKEFEVLGEAWEKLNEALSHVANLVTAIQSYPKLDDMSEPRFEAFVDQCKLDDVDRDELLGKPIGERSSFYKERIIWYRLRDARTACNELHRAIQRNSIFLEPGIRELFRKIDTETWSTLMSREIGEEAGDHKYWLNAGQRFNTEVVPLKDEIERQVQKRLGYE